jgi:hypothetical protein
MEIAMDKFILAAAVTFNPGAVLGLTKEQAEPRKSNLESLGKGNYLVKESVQFKAGEKLGHEGALPKNIADKVASAADDKAEAKAKAEAEAKAKAEAEKK